MGRTGALGFDRTAFGAKELERRTMPTGKPIHGRPRIGHAAVMLSDVFPGADVAAPSTVGTTTVALHRYAPNPDALWDRAGAAGANVSMPLENQYGGEPYRPLLYPFGHRWSLSMTVRMARAERGTKQAEVGSAFRRGEDPRREPPSGDACGSGAPCPALRPDRRRDRPARVSARGSTVVDRSVKPSDPEGAR